MLLIHSYYVLLKFLNDPSYTNISFYRAIILLSEIESELLLMY